MADPVPPQIDKKLFLSLILSAGTLLYVVAVFWIGVESIGHVQSIGPGATPKPYPISEFIVQVLLIIGTALATHLGAFLGISVTQGGAGIHSTRGLFAYLLTADGIPGLLAFVYFLTLIAAVIFWALTGFSPYAGKPLQDLSYSFLGVFAGAMAALSKS